MHSIRVGLRVGTLIASLVFPTLVANAQQDPRIEVARTKGKVSWYAAIFPDEMRRELTERFKARTGIDVVTYVGGTGQIFSRLLTERRAGAHNVDVVTISDVDLLADLVKEKAVASYVPAASEAIADTYRDPENNWSAIAFWACVLEYNARTVKKGGAPKTWGELADAKWKSKVAINDPGRSALGFLFLKVMVREHGWDWIAQLMRNDPLVIAVGPGVDQSVVKGERQLGTAVSAYASETMKAGGPVGIALDEALFVSPMTASLVSDAPNPEGAGLLIDYLLSKEAGDIYAKYGWFSVRADVNGPFGFPAASQLKVRYPIVPHEDTRQQMLDQFNAIAQAARK